MRRLPLVPLLALAALLAACIDPADRRPGLRLSGEVVEEPVDDWSFSDDHGEIFIETSPPWLIPHSVTIVCVAHDGQLYVGAREPVGKRWVENVARDPEVRIEIGARIYERRLEPLEEAVEIEGVYQAFVAKYEREALPPEERPEVWYWRVVPRDG